MGWNIPGIESWWRVRFSAPVQTGPGVHPASCTVCNRASFPGVKRPGRGVHRAPQSTAEIKQRVELYLYSPTAPWWQILGGFFFLTSGNYVLCVVFFADFYLRFELLGLNIISYKNNLDIIKNSPWKSSVMYFQVYNWVKISEYKYIYI